MFRNFMAGLAATLRKTFDWFFNAVWRFIKKVPHWLYKFAVFLFWIALYTVSGAEHLLSNHIVMAIGRFLVAALGIFVFLALFSFVDGTPRKLLTLLTPFRYLFAWTVFLLDWTASIRNWALRGFAEMTLLFLVVPFVAWFMKFWSLSAPIRWFLLGACALLVTCAYLRGTAGSPQRILVAEAVRAVFLPIAFGLALVCWMQVVFNLYDHNVLSIRLIENHIGYLSEQAEKWVNFSVPATISLTISLIALSLIAPRWKAVTRVSRGKTFLHAAAAVVACVASFTFLAQAPFKVQDHQETKRLEAERKQEGNRDNLRLLAMESVQQALEAMAPEQREQSREGMREMMSKLNELAPYRDHGRILEAMAQRTVEAGAADKSASLAALAKRTGSGTGNAGQEAPLPKGAANELLTGVGSLFSDLVGAATPELQGMAGKFLESLVDKESDRFYEERIRPGLQTRLADLLPTATLFTGSAIVRQFAGGAGGNMPTDLAAETSKEEQEVLQEEERVQSESERAEPEQDFVIEP
jgi:hypothetical protein